MKRINRLLKVLFSTRRFTSAPDETIRLYSSYWQHTLQVEFTGPLERNDRMAGYDHGPSEDDEDDTDSFCPVQCVQWALCVGYRNKNTSKDVQPDRLFFKLKLNALRLMTTVSFKFPDPNRSHTAESKISQSTTSAECGRLQAAWHVIEEMEISRKGSLWLIEINESIDKNGLIQPAHFNLMMLLSSTVGLHQVGSRWVHLSTRYHFQIFSSATKDTQKQSSAAVSHSGESRSICPSRQLVISFLISRDCFVQTFTHDLLHC